MVLHRPVETARLFRQSEHRYGASTLGLSFPMRPLGPTTKGRERAFQFWFESGASVGPGLRARQFLPSSVEMSVPFGPTVISACDEVSNATEDR